MSIVIRPARQADAAQIVRMVNRFAAQNIMLPRTEENVRQTISDWLVAVEAEMQPVTDSQMNQRLPPESNTSQYVDQASLKYDSDVYPAEQQIVGCGALVPLNDALAEVRSLAIDESQHGKGLGSTLVIALVNMARQRGYAQLCALTLRPKFFIRLGFEQVDRWSISPKVWQACIYCPKFHRCDEVAVLMKLASTQLAADEQNRKPAWNHLLKWGEWQPLRLAYRYEYQGEERAKPSTTVDTHNPVETHNH